MKCLRKRPRDRYASAGELADDLLRFRTDEPIQAKPPSTLTKTFRWVRRHRVTASIAAVLLVLSLTAAGIWTRHQYLYAWEYTETFAAFVKYHGQYQGLAPALTEEAVAHRGLSYRIVRAGRDGRCLRLTCAGPDGKPSWMFASTDVLVPGLLDDVARHRLPCVFELRYNGEGQVAEERVFDAAGQLITRFRYSYPQDYDPAVPQTAYITGDFVDEFSAPLKTASGLSSVQFERDSSGREIRMLYADALGQPLKDKTGAGGMELSYHPEGMISRVTVLNEKGKPAPNRDGRAMVKTEWAAPGRPVSEAYFDLAGQPITVHGFHIARMECDRWGNLIATRYLAADGVTPARRLVPGLSGPSEIKWTFDDRGRMASLTSSGYDAAASGFTSLVTRLEWTGNGVIYREVAQDAGGKPARGTGSGYHTSAMTYDTLGRVLRVERNGFDPGRTGYFRDVETTAWTDAGNKQRSELRYFDEQGQPALNKSLSAACKVKEYGPDGLLTRETVSGFDPKEVTYEKQVLDLEWQTTDAAGARRFPGSADDSAAEAAGTAATEPAGVDFARSGRAKPGPIQIAINSRNAKLRKKTGRYFDEHDQPATTTKGNSQWERRFDDEGRETVEIHTGFHAAEYPYARVVINTSWDKDGKGRTSVWNYENAAGKPVRNKERYLTYSETYDESGHVIRIVEDGHDETKKPYARVETTVSRDEVRKEKSLAWNYSNSAGQPVRHEDGYRTYTEVQDAAGRTIRRIQAGYDEAVHFYDTETIETAWTGKLMSRRQWIYTNAAGQRVRYQGEYMDYIEHYDEQGEFSRLEIAGYDAAKFSFFKKVTQAVPGPDAATIARVSRWEDEQGQPARGSIGELESREERSADENRPLRTIATGFDEARHGFSKMAAQHGAAGAVIAVEYADSRGQAVTRVRPFIRRIIPGSAAASLNLKVGDALLAYNDRTTGNMFDYVQNTKLKGGTLQILRDGQPILLKDIPPGELGIYLEDRALPP